MKKTFLFLILTLTFLRFFGANNPFIKTFSVLDGLPTDYIYAIHQDSQGFIWVASDAGVLRYDGNNFMQFSMRDGLDDITILNIKEDMFGRVWFFNMTGTVNYFWKNEIHNLGNTPFLKELKTDYFLYDFYQDKDSTLYFYNIFGEIYAVNDDIFIDYINLKFNNVKQLGLFYLNKSSNGNFLAWAGDGIYSFKNFDDSFFHYPIEELFEKVLKGKNNQVIAIDKMENINLYQDENLLEDNIFQLETEYIRSGLTDRDGYLWIATYDKGVYCIKNRKLILHLDIKFSNHVSEDKQGNIWVASRGYGIYKINRAILKYKYLGKENFGGQSPNTLAKANDGNLWAATFDEIFYVRNKEMTYPLGVELKGSGTHDLVQLKNGTLLAAGLGTQMYIIKNTRFNSKTESVQYGFVGKPEYVINKLAIKKDEKTIYSRMNDRIMRIFPENGYACQFIDYNIGITYNLIINSNDRLFANGSINRIINEFPENKMLTSINHRELNRPLQPLNGKGIHTHIVLDGDKDVYNIYGNQLYLQSDTNLYELSKDFELQIDHRIKNMAYDGSTLFFHTINTVYYIKNPLQIIYGTPVLLNNINIEFNNIHDILYQDSLLFIADDDGLSMIPTENISADYDPLPRPYFSKIYLNDREINFTSGKIEFTGLNKLGIEFGNLNFSTLPVEYRYKLDGYDEDWQESFGNNITYLDLEPGEYTFELQSNLINNLTGDTAELKIVISPTFFQKKGTWVLAVFLIFSLIVFVILRIKNRQLKQKENESLMLSLEHKALQSMMNPHFIFNALGSIQSYLLQNKSSEAGTYLSRFARLIRQNMNSLKSNSINVEDETERLRNYLELEKFRADSKFNYTIEVDEDLDSEEIKIPSMILQPFVENAIWHGVSSLLEKGQIDIRFQKLTDKQLLIIVADNGVGIKKSRESSNSGEHLHMGISLTQKRLKLIGEKLGVNSEIITEERFPGQPNPGVKVKITVPILNRIDGD